MKKTFCDYNMRKNNKIKRVCCCWICSLSISYIIYLSIGSEILSQINTIAIYSISSCTNEIFLLYFTCNEISENWILQFNLPMIKYAIYINIENSSYFTKTSPSEPSDPLTVLKFEVWNLIFRSLINSFARLVMYGMMNKV